MMAGAGEAFLGQQVEDVCGDCRAIWVPDTLSALECLYLNGHIREETFIMLKPFLYYLC